MDQLKTPPPRAAAQKHNSMQQGAFMRAARILRRHVMRTAAAALLSIGLAALSTAAARMEGTDLEGLDTAAFEQFARQMAQQHQLDEQKVLAALEASEYRQDIIDAITTPAESLPWSRYRPIFLKEGRIADGTAFWQAHADTLRRAQAEYGVPPKILVAIIGVESRYGEHRGRLRVIDALRTLAFDYPARADFFRSELEQFFLLARDEHLDPLEPTGSYAGAMGIPQFISSSYREYAVDFNGNGRRDLWSEPADAIGSVANYFHRHGWKPGAPVSVPVQVHGDRWRTLANDSLRPQSTIGELRRSGVEVPGRFDAALPASLLALDGATGKEYHVTFGNFYVITRYNHSPLYAMAVHQLADAIAARKEGQ